MNFTVVQQKLEITQKELDATKTLLTSTRNELSQTKSTVDDQARKLNGKMTLFGILVLSNKIGNLV
jgi:hypothetical protein